MSSKSKKRKKSPPAAAPAVAAPAEEPANSAAWAGAGARILVGAVLLAAGLQKASSAPEEFAAVIEAYRILPPAKTLFFATVMPWLQILTGLAMILGYLSRASSLAGGALLAVFIGALGSVLARGIPLKDCGCFNGIHMTPAQTIALDSVLACLAYFAYRKGGSFALLDSWISKGE